MTPAAASDVMEKEVAVPVHVPSLKSDRDWSASPFCLDSSSGLMDICRALVVVVGVAMCFTLILMLRVCGITKP